MPEAAVLEVQIKDNGTPPPGPARPPALPADIAPPRLPKPPTAPKPPAKSKQTATHPGGDLLEQIAGHLGVGQFIAAIKDLLNTVKPPAPQPTIPPAANRTATPAAPQPAPPAPAAPQPSPQFAPPAPAPATPQAMPPGEHVGDVLSEQLAVQKQIHASIGALGGKTTEAETPAPPAPTVNVPPLPSPSAPTVLMPPNPAPPAPNITVPPLPAPSAPTVLMQPNPAPPAPTVTVPPLPAPPAPTILVPPNPAPPAPQINVPPAPTVNVPPAPTVTVPPRPAAPAPAPPAPAPTAAPTTATAATGALADLASAAVPVGAAFAVANKAADVMAGAFDGVRSAIEMFGSQIESAAGNDYLGVFKKGLDAVHSPLKDIPVVGKVFEAQVQAMIAPVKAFTGVVEAFNRRAEELAAFSPALAMAEAKSEIRSLMDDMKEADTLGPDLARMVSAETNLNHQLRELLLPIKNVAVNIVANTLENIAAILETLRVLVNPEYWLEVVSDAVRAALPESLGGITLKEATDRITAKVQELKAAMEGKDDPDQTYLRDLYDLRFNTPARRERRRTDPRPSIPIVDPVLGI